MDPKQLIDESCEEIKKAIASLELAKEKLLKLRLNLPDVFTPSFRHPPQAKVMASEGVGKIDKINTSLTTLSTYLKSSVE